MSWFILLFTYMVSISFLSLLLKIYKIDDDFLSTIVIIFSWYFGTLIKLNYQIKYKKIFWDSNLIFSKIYVLTFDILSKN